MRSSPTRGASSRMRRRICRTNAVDGRSGEFQERLRVYAREGEPCPRCGEVVHRIVQAVPHVLLTVPDTRSALTHAAPAIVDRLSVSVP